MACEKPTELTKAAKVVRDLWTKAGSAIDKYNFSSDMSVFARMFDTVTGKPFVEGAPITVKDLKKMKVAIEDLEIDLKNPGVLSNKMLKHLYVGSAKGMRNPITGKFYDTLVRANEFRNRNTQNMLANFNGMISSLKMALIEADGIDTSKFSSTEQIYKTPGQKLKELKATKKINTLKDYELAIIKNIREGKPVSTKDTMNLKNFFENEGVAFQDLVDRVEAGSDSLLRAKYKDVPNKELYISRINEAASNWNGIQTQAKGHLVQAIDNLVSTIDLKYGKRSNTGRFLIDEYKLIAKKLEDNTDPYLPHFVLDIVGQSMEIRDKMLDVKNDTDIDNILKEYVTKTKDINTNLSNRLKSKSVDRDKGYWSKNPFLFAGKYIEQVTQFNHSTYIDRAYTEGLHDLTKVIFKDPSGEIGKTAKVYKDILTEQYNSAVSKGGESPKQVNDLVRFLTSLQFISKLGISPRGALRNLTQRTFHHMYFGTKMVGEAVLAYNGDMEYDKAAEDRLNFHGLKFYDVSKVTDGAVTQSDLKIEGIDYESGTLTYKDKQRVIKQIAGFTGKVAEASSIMTKIVENGNRRSTFRIAFHKRVKDLKMTKEFSNWGESEKTRNKMYEMAGRQAARITSMLHFEYSPFGKASALTGNVGSFLFQFQHYRMSFLNLQAQLLKDYKRAFKAGDYTGEELGRLVRLGGIHALSEALSVGLGVGLTTYVANDTLDWLMNFKDLFSEDEEVQKKAFYGKGALGAVGSVPLSDAMEIYNLGSAAGYWKLLSDEDETLGFLAGMREYKKIDNTEFAGSIAGMFNLEIHRFITRTWPTLRNYGVMTALGQELALYPGETTIGLNTRDLHKKYVKEKVKKPVSWRKASGGLSKKSRNRAIQSLDLLSD